MASDLFIAEMIRTEDGKLTYVHKSDKERLNKEISELRIGQKVRMMIDFTKDDARASQISRIHAMIGDIAKESGHEFNDVKKEIKERAGLLTPDEKLKSFANCSCEEMTSAIQSAMELAKFLGMSLKK